jgi:hypothetical protein
MTSLVIAFFFAISAIIASFYILTTMGIPKEIAGPASIAILASVHPIYKTLDLRQKLAKADTGLDLIHSLEDYGLPMTRLILFGWLFMLAALELASAVSGIIVAYGEIEIESAFIPMTLVVFIMGGSGIFLTGRWIGRRYISHGVITVIIAVLITRFSATLIDIILVPKAFFNKLLGIETSIDIFILSVISGTISFSAFGLIGFWRGRHQRLTDYLDYVMKQVSPNARKVIVELAYEEAKKSSQEIGKSQA